MPYYRITIVRKNGRMSKGIKEDYMTDIDRYAEKAYRKALLALKDDLNYFEVVMLTSTCEEVRKYNEKKRQPHELQLILQQLPAPTTYGYPFIEIVHNNKFLRFAKSDVLENGFVTGKFEWKLVS